MRKVKLIYFLLVIILVSCKNTDDQKLFTELSSGDTGIKFKNLVRETEELNVLTYSSFYQGAGVAVGDLNNDGLPDIYFTGNMVASRLYLNKGDWEFEEISEKAGVAAAGLWNTGVTMADVNGDGWLDIYVCRSAANDYQKRKNLLFINKGDLTFTEQAEAYGLADPAYSTQAVFFDYDQDGDLDMFSLNYSSQEYAGFSKIIGKFKERKNKTLGDKLFRNDGGHFTDVTESAGILNNVLGFGLGVSVTDANNDGWMDIYVTNDYNEEDYFYLNQKDGTFKESLKDHFGHVSFFSMGVDAADINNDLRPDLITVDMLPESSYNQKMVLGPEHHDKYRQLTSQGFFPQTMRNMLQLNQGNGYFSEVGQLAGISNTDWSWAVLAADYDNDGWKDVLITNGYMRNYLDMDFINYLVEEKQKSAINKEIVFLDLVSKMPPIAVENYLYKSNGDLTFTKSSKEWGMEDKTISNAAAYADLDNDGDLDLIISNINSEASIYKNNSESLTKNNFLKVQLKGNDKNTFGIGAKVILYIREQQLYQEMIPVRGFQSSVNNELVFGVGERNSIDSLKVVWPDAKEQIIYKVPVNQKVVLLQQEAQKVPEQSNAQKTIFAEVADNLGINFTHEESDYEDFKEDRMMPNAISTSGPKIIRGDINKDGLEDFYLGGAKGSPGKLFKQLNNGTFVETSQEAFEADKGHYDTDGVFFDVDNDGDHDLYVVSGGSDYTEDSPELQDRLYINDGKGTFSLNREGLPEMLTSGSAVTAGDFDNDGLMDLFIGGRSVPGKYPLAPRSYLLRNNGQGKFEDVTHKFCPDLLKSGMVTDARFLNLNGDNLVDLLVIGEWMEIGVFTNSEGKRFEQKKDAVKQETSGWWLSIEASDFDNDGDTDLVLGNYGLNNPYQPDAKHPATLVFKDFDDNGKIDPIFSYYIADTNHFAYSRDELLGQIPSIRKKFPDYQSFAASRPADFFSSEEMAGADSLKAFMFESIYLENDGKGNFSLKHLPKEAQFSPVFALASTDLNKDGHLDILTGGNLTKSRVSTGKQDANYGIVLLGDGKGGFSTLDPSISGLKIKGDVRDINIIKIKGAEFSVISRNNDSVKVYKILNLPEVEPKTLANF